MDNQEVELELAWLVKYLPKDLRKSKNTEIFQAYLENTDPNIKDIRIREKDGIFTYTVKSFIKSFQETGYTREVTKELSREKFINLRNQSKKHIRKIRYYYPLAGNLSAEIDVYKEKLEGLIVVEVEFPSIGAFKKFKAPKWFGKEVTDSVGIYPPVIADMSLKKINEINNKYQQKPHEFE